MGTPFRVVCELAVMHEEVVQKTEVTRRLSNAVEFVAKYLQNEWCRRGESNPRPRDYETLALPLSYAGTSAAFDAKGLLHKVSRHERARRNIMG